MVIRRINGDLRLIIVYFKFYRVKNELYKVRKYLKLVSLNNYFYNIKVVYINENFISYRRGLFVKVRKFRKDNYWYSVWIIDGNIFVRKF